MNKLPDDIKTKMAMDRIGRKLCAYLQKQYDLGNIEFRIAMQSKTHFIIHVPNKDSDTIDIDWGINQGEVYGSEVFGYINKNSNNTTQ